MNWINQFHRDLSEFHSIIRRRGFKSEDIIVLVPNILKLDYAKYMSQGVSIFPIDLYCTDICRYESIKIQFTSPERYIYIYVKDWEIYGKDEASNRYRIKIKPEA